MLLTTVQTLHPLITYINFLALFYIIYMHVAQKRGGFLWVAYGLIGFECLVVFFSGMVCPIRIWVTRHYSASTPDQIILNDFAHYYLKAGSTLLVAAIATYFIPLKKRRSENGSQ